MRPRGHALGVALSALNILCSGCSGPDDGGVPELYLASAADDDGDVSIALLVDGAHVTAYACPDDVAHDGYAGWFYGERSSDGDVEVHHDGWSMHALEAGDTIEGTIVTPEGKALRWRATRAPADGLTGLYSAAGSGWRAGVIVRARGASETPLVRGAWSDDKTHQAYQVVPVMPLELVAGRLEVSVATPRGARTIYVTPLDGMGP